MLGVVQVDLKIKHLDDVNIKAKLHILKNSLDKSAIILERDFIESNQLTLVYKCVKDKDGNKQQKVGLFNKIALGVIEDEPDHTE